MFDDNVFAIIKSHLFSFVCVLTWSLLGVTKSLGHAQIGLFYAFNSKFPKSIRTTFICAVPPAPSGVSVTYENERISKKNSLPYLKCDRRDITHILSKVSCFLLKSFHFHRLQKRQVFSPYKSLYCECYATTPMLADAHISSLGCLCCYQVLLQKREFILRETHKH